MNAHLERMITELLKEFTEQEIINAARRLAAGKSHDEIRTMKHVDKAVDNPCGLSKPPTYINPPAPPTLKTSVK